MARAIQTRSLVSARGTVGVVVLASFFDTEEAFTAR